MKDKRVILGFIFFSLLISCLDSGKRFTPVDHKYPEIIHQVDSLIQLAKDSLDSRQDSAVAIYRKVLEIAREYKYRHGMGESAYQMGLVFRDRGNYLESHSLLMESLDNFLATGVERDIARAYSGLGSLHHRLENYEKALDFYYKSLFLYRKLGADRSAGQLYNNIGAIFLSIDRPEKADSFLTRAVELFSTLGDSVNLVSPLINLGEVSELGKDSAGAVKYYEMSFKLAKKTGSSSDQMNSMFFLGKMYGDMGKLNESRELLDSAYQICRQHGSTNERKEITRKLQDICSKTGDTLQAYHYLLESTGLQDIEQQEKTNKELRRAEFIELEKMSEMQIRNRTNLALWMFAGLLISILFILVIYRTYKVNQKSARLLREMDELKSKLFSNITHEFRTPLTLILGPLEEMLAAGEKNNPSRNELKMMRRNANRLLNLVNQMLDLARLDAKSLRIELSRSDVCKFFRIRVISFIPLAGQKKIEFFHSVPDEPFITWFDRDKLEKIINNLLSNAVKFTGPGGEIRCEMVLVNPEKELIRFEVSDTGKGIPENHLAKIFDRFHQVEGSLGSNTFSTGIGLSLTRELIHLMHGEITVESESGKGTRFCVDLPLGKNHLSGEEYRYVESEVPDIIDHGEHADQEDEGTGDTGKAICEKKQGSQLPIVLIVEDQKEIRDYIGEHLKDCSRVMEAENGRQGFEIAVRNIPDLIITDLIMPEINGTELCRKLKTDERTSHIPVVMLTAKAGIKDRMEGIETGADVYLTKPFNIREVRLVVIKLIEQRKKLRERFSTDIRLEPGDIAITSADKKFLDRALAVIETHMGDADFEVNGFQNEMAMSRMQLFRKIKALTNQSPGEFIRNIRLKRAAQLIEKGFGNMAEITYEIGFSNPSHFAKCFREMYGSIPSDYAKKFLRK